MPHDIRGRLIEKGDTIKVKPLNDEPEKSVIGHIIDIHSDTQECTGQVQWPFEDEHKTDYFGASDCELLLKANRDEPDPLASAVPPLAD